MALQKAAATARQTKLNAAGCCFAALQFCWSRNRETEALLVSQGPRPVPSSIPPPAPPPIPSHADPCSLTHTQRHKLTAEPRAGGEQSPPAATHGQARGRLCSKGTAVAPWYVSTATPAPLGVFIAAGATGIVNAISHPPDGRPGAHLLLPFTSANGFMPTKHDLQRGKAKSACFCSTQPCSPSSPASLWRLRAPASISHKLLFPNGNSPGWTHHKERQLLKVCRTGCPHAALVPAPVPSMPQICNACSCGTVPQCPYPWAAITLQSNWLRSSDNHMGGSCCYVCLQEKDYKMPSDRSSPAAEHLAWNVFIHTECLHQL